MLEFIRKSLAVRIWIQPLNSYAYSVHDLILNNLKNKIDDKKEKVSKIKKKNKYY